MGEPETVIQVSNLGKKYVIDHAGERAKYATFRDTVAGGVRSLGRRLLGRGGAAADTREEFWALRDVSFEVKRGEVVGIIGRNGAGKSTLLKILSRITEPTTGRIEIEGRVASLLEVGTGFHAELSGRENIYLNGSILGMSRAEIRRKFDEIVAFAEVEKFLDTPVKRYSSGMYMRLAFAVAAHLESEILIVDEVLAVGDAEFQTKCLGKMSEVARGGRTVLFVSHNLPAAQSLCQIAAWVEQGRIKAFGDCKDVVTKYLTDGTIGVRGGYERSWCADDPVACGKHVRLLRVAIVPTSSARTQQLHAGDGFDLTVEYCIQDSLQTLMLDFCLYAEDGCAVWETVSASTCVCATSLVEPGRYRTVCHVPDGYLNEGRYRVRLLFSDSQCNPFYDNRDCLAFVVYEELSRSIPWFGRFAGFIRPRFQWNTALLT